MGILSKLGLMTVEAAKLQAAADKQLIERIKGQLDAADRTIGKLYNERDDALAKFKITATDLAAQAGEIKLKTEAGDNLLNWIAGLESEIEALRPDALKWRDYLKRSRDRKAAKAGVVS